MPRFVIEPTSGNAQCQLEVEAADELSALEHYFSHQFPIRELLTEHTLESHKGWKQIVVSIGPGVCEECFEPSPETERCAECTIDRGPDKTDPDRNRGWSKSGYYECENIGCGETVSREGEDDPVFCAECIEDRGEDHLPS